MELLAPAACHLDETAQTNESGVGPSQRQLSPTCYSDEQHHTFVDFDHVMDSEVG
jgi:hypothetical protein